MNEIDKALDYIKNPVGKTVEQHEQFEQMAIIALTQMREREQNRPLTLEELQQMDGEPVWIEVYSNKQSVGQCHIIHSISGTNVVFMGGGSGLHVEDYEEKWLAYKYNKKQNKVEGGKGV